MSYSAQGWAQRQVFGSPILKGVMQALCYLMRDDELTVWAAVTNPEDSDKVSLEKLTEYEERAIRKALRDLVELGFLQDTGERRRNMTVWRMPRYEAWLERAENTTPPVLGRGQEIEPPAPLQGADSPPEKTAESAPNNDPSREGEGFSRETSTPPVQGSDPSRLRTPTPPVEGRESSLDLGSTKPARAMRVQEWKAQARIRYERAPAKATKDTQPGIALKGHWHFWIRMVGFCGNYWLSQWGTEPTPEWIRLLNLWNTSGKWAELEKVIEEITLAPPEHPPNLAEIEALFRKVADKRPPFDEHQARRYWWQHAIQFLEGAACALELCPFRTQAKDLPAKIRDKLVPKCQELAAWAVNEQREHPNAHNRIAKHVEEKISEELKPFVPPPAALTTAAGEEPVFTDEPAVAK